MKTNNLSILMLAALCVLGVTTACQTNTQPKSSVVNSPAAQTVTDTVQPEAPKTATDKPAAASLASPTDAYKTAYAARQKKDVNGLKKVLSKKMLGFFTEMAADEHKSLDDGLKELAEQPQAATAETRNEKITGDRAQLEYLDERGKWKQMDFVKEGGAWKLTLPNAQPTIIQDTTKNHK